MSNVRNWASSFIVAALILFAPVIAFVVVITAEMLTDLVAKLGGTTVWPVAAGVMGWVLLTSLRRAASHISFEVGRRLTELAPCSSTTGHHLGGAGAVHRGKPRPPLAMHGERAFLTIVTSPRQPPPIVGPI
jgi:hypothetical protein